MAPAWGGIGMDAMAEDPRLWRRRSRRARALRVLRDALGTVASVLGWALMGAVMATGALMAIALWAKLGLPLYGVLERLR